MQQSRDVALCADEDNGRRSGRYTPRQSRRYNQQSPQYYQRHATSPHTTPRRGRAPAAHHTPRRSALQPIERLKPYVLHLAPILNLSLLPSHLVFPLLFDAVSLIVLLPCPGSPCPRYSVPDSQSMKQCCYVGVGGIKTASADLVATPQAGAPGMLLQVSFSAIPSPPAGSSEHLGF